MRSLLSKPANVRIHVERVIGNVRKKYSLLSDTQPLDFVISADNQIATLDKMVTVACALVTTLSFLSIKFLFKINLLSVK